MNSNNHTCYDEEDEDDVPLPGFRFHPTDEELVGFYLRRKVDNKFISIELIKQIDIYKYNPWDLPKFNSIVGEKESYFFCKRERKYKNSVRPNRVTGFGFWKATGIDKPVYSNGGSYGGGCIGLKKTLVYYRGCAGRGTKTDWMMHEFRLPSMDGDSHLIKNNTSPISINLQEAEIITLCRIFKRNASHRKNLPAACKPFSTRRFNEKSSKSGCSVTVDSISEEAYISFAINSGKHEHFEKKPIINPSLTMSQPESAASGVWRNQNASELFTCNGWDEFDSVMEFQFPGDF